MRGSGGILLIGIAVVLIAASVTGRLDALWSALRGSGGTDNGDGGNGNGKPLPAPPSEGADETNCDAGEWLVTLGSGERQCYAEGNIASPETINGAQNQCRTGWEIGTHQQQSGPVNVCIKRQTGTRPHGLGQAGFGRYNLVQLPTGFSGYRYAPNV